MIKAKLFCKEVFSIIKARNSTLRDIFQFTATALVAQSPVLFCFVVSKLNFTFANVDQQTSPADVLGFHVKSWVA